MSDGPARNPSSVQKGSTLFLSTRTGDPTTPGYPSKKDSPRADISEVIAKIPALPISYSAAQPLLQALNGHGVTAEKVNRTAWTGGLDADYSSGPAPGVKLALSTVSRDSIEPVHNVIGVINGTNADETIIIGNHRDTWMVVSNAAIRYSPSSSLTVYRAVTEIPTLVLRSSSSLLAHSRSSLIQAGSLSETLSSHLGMLRNGASLALLSGLRSMSTGSLTPPSHI